MKPYQPTLTNNESDTCVYIGVFGALIAATCLIQHFVIARSHWITFLMMALFVFSLVSYITLTLLKSFAPVLLIVSAVFIFGMEVFHVFSGVYSLALILFLIYNVVTVVLLYMDGLPQKLIARQAIIRAEEMAWQDKL
jgi:hypothetical protein